MVRWLFLLFVALVGCAPEVSQSNGGFVGAVVSGMQVDGGVVLSGHDGKSYRLDGFKGKVVALFFGYTHCPDVCPTTMAELNRVVVHLGAQAKDVQVLFVTLDPERDSVDVLSRYVPYFNPAFIGLRGDENTTKKLARDFKVFYSQQASNSKSVYTIDHSAGVYVFDKKGNLRLYLNYGQGGKEIAHDLAILLGEK